MTSGTWDLPASSTPPRFRTEAGRLGAARPRIKIVARGSDKEDEVALLLDVQDGSGYPLPAPARGLKSKNDRIPP